MATPIQPLQILHQRVDSDGNIRVRFRVNKTGVFKYVPEHCAYTIDAGTTWYKARPVVTNVMHSRDPLFVTAAGTNFMYYYYGPANDGLNTAVMLPSDVLTRITLLETNCGRDNPITLPPQPTEPINQPPDYSGPVTGEPITGQSPATGEPVRPPWTGEVPPGTGQPPIIPPNTGGVPPVTGEPGNPDTGNVPDPDVPPGSGDIVPGSPGTGGNPSDPDPVPPGEPVPPEIPGDSTLPTDGPEDGQPPVDSEPSQPAPNDPEGPTTERGKYEVPAGDTPSGNRNPSDPPPPGGVVLTPEPDQGAPNDDGDVTDPRPPGDETPAGPGPSTDTPGSPSVPPGVPSPPPPVVIPGTPTSLPTEGDGPHVPPDLSTPIDPGDAPTSSPSLPSEVGPPPIGPMPRGINPPAPPGVPPGTEPGFDVPTPPADGEPIVPQPLILPGDGPVVEPPHTQPIDPMTDGSDPHDPNAPEIGVGNQPIPVDDGPFMIVQPGTEVPGGTDTRFPYETTSTPHVPNMGYDIGAPGHNPMELPINPPTGMTVEMVLVPETVTRIDQECLLTFRVENTSYAANIEAEMVLEFHVPETGMHVHLLSSGLFVLPQGSHMLLSAVVPPHMFERSGVGYGIGLLLVNGEPLVHAESSVQITEFTE